MVALILEPIFMTKSSGYTEIAIYSGNKQYYTGAYNTPDSDYTCDSCIK